MAACVAVGVLIQGVYLAPWMDRGFEPPWLLWCLRLGVIVLGAGATLIVCLGPLWRGWAARSLPVRVGWLVAALLVGIGLSGLVPVATSVETDVHTIEIVATGRSNPKATGSEVWVFGLFDAEGRRLPISQFRRSGTWELSDHALRSRQGQPARLRWRGSLPEGQLRLLCEPMCGIAEIRLDDRRWTEDLYAPKRKACRVAIEPRTQTGWLPAKVARLGHALVLAAIVLAASGAVLSLAAPPSASSRRAMALQLLLLVPIVALLVDGLYAVRHMDAYAANGPDAAFVAVAAACAGWLCLAGRSDRYRPHAVLALGVTLACLGLGEVAARLLRPTPLTRTPWPAHYRHVATAADTMPGVSGTIEVSTNGMGLRGPEIDLAQTDLAILCIGGSTTECLYITDRESWPWRLQDMLAEQLGRRVFVGNAGRSGHFTSHHVYQLRHYAPVPEFDWVVVMCGINDLGCLVWDNRAARERRVPDEALIPLPSTRDSYAERRWKLIAMAGDTWRRLRRGQEANVLIQDQAGESYREIRQRRRDLLAKKTYRAAPEGLDEALARYGDDLHEIIRTCRDRGPRLLMLTQPTIWRADLPPELRAIVSTYSRDGAYAIDVLAEMMGRFNVVMRGVCRAEDVPCIDLDAALPKDDTVFYDDCHFNRAGCRRVAEILARFFASTARVQQELARPGPGGLPRNRNGSAVSPSSGTASRSPPRGASLDTPADSRPDARPSRRRPAGAGHTRRPPPGPARPPYGIARPCR